MSKRKAYWDMTTKELAQATRCFDDPGYDPPAVKPTTKQSAQLRRWKRKYRAQHATLTLALDQRLIHQADEYAADHGLTISELVSDALRRLMRKKSA
jgi:hypothetical protein